MYGADVLMEVSIVLARVSPAERLVVVLHAVFDFPFEKVAPLVGRPVAACRQLASRARKRVEEEAGSARFTIDPAEQRRVIDAFIAACASGDIKTLLPLLDPSVMGWADLGGPLPAVSRPNVGIELVAAPLMRYFGAASGNKLVAHVINGELSVVAFFEGVVVSVLALTVTSHRISRVYVVSDPRKLTHAKRVLDQER